MFSPCWFLITFLALSAIAYPQGTDLNILIGQPLFDAIKPVANSLLLRNLNNLNLPDLDLVLPVPDVADVGFHVTGMKVVNATIKPASGMRIVDGAVRLNFVGVGVGLEGSYNVSLNDIHHEGTVAAYNELGIRGDMVFTRGEKSIKIAIPNLEILFTKLTLSFSEPELNQSIIAVQEMYGPIIKGVLGLLLTTSVKELIIPLVNMVLTNQINLGISSRSGSTTFAKFKLVQDPVITAGKGIQIPISFELAEM